MDLKSEFERAVVDIKSIDTAPANDTMLDLYSLYKQATAGDISGKRPGMLDLKGKAKFDAWSSKKGLGQDLAMQNYIELVKNLLEN